jgi:hypothetical protein
MNQDQCLHVSFARPLVHSFSRQPTKIERFYIEMYEYHVEGCSRCRPILGGYWSNACWRGNAIKVLITLSFWMSRGGKVYSTLDEHGRPVQIEMPQGFRAVSALLKKERAARFDFKGR